MARRRCSARVAAALGWIALAGIAARPVAAPLSLVEGAVGSPARCPGRGVCVVEARSRYPMDAQSVRHLLQAVEEGGLPHPGGRAHALSGFELVIAYTPVDQAGRCTLEGLRLRLEVALWLPEFVGSDSASERVRAQAAALGAALLHHEEGHVHIALAHAHALLAELHALPPAVDCRNARDAVARLQIRHSLRHELAQQRYDARTRHGAAQGAVLERWRDAAPASRFSRGTGLPR